jgi:prepilin-type processing-associated H-X9-DG protein
MFPIEVMQAAMIQETSLDPLAAEQIVIAASPPAEGPPAYSVLAKFCKPASLKPGEMTRHAEKASLEGKEYFQSKEMMLPSFYPVDENSLLAAPDFAITQLLGRHGASDVAPLAAELAAADKGDDLLMLVDLEQLRPLLMMAVAQAELPPELASLQEIPALMKRVELRVNVSRPQATELIVAANSDADAERVVAIFNGLKQLLAKKMLEESQKALASDDPVEQAGGRYSQRMMKYWDARMQLVREGDRLIIFRGDLANNPQQQLTYIATIGVLVALLLPAVQAAREAARRNTSINNIKQIMLGLLNYESARTRFPAHASYDGKGKPLLSWRVHLLPFMEENVLYSQFKLDEPWDSEHNKQLITRMPALYWDPSSRLAPTDGRTHYLGVKGEGHFFDGTDKGRTLAGIRDGTSNTMAIVQVDDDAAAIWTKPDDWTPDANDLLKPFDGPHPGGFLAGFCDGHVMFISQSVEVRALKEMLTVAGGEKLAK